MADTNRSGESIRETDAGEDIHHTPVPLTESEQEPKDVPALEKTESRLQKVTSYRRRANSTFEPGTELRVHDTSAIDPPTFTNFGEDEKDDGTSSLKAARLTMRRRILSAIKFFRPYWLLDYLDYQSVCIIARSWAKAWLCAVFTLINPVNRWLGQASYLMMIYSFVVPCGNFSIIQSIIFGVICVAAACFGWLIAIISSAISARLNGNHPAEYYSQIIIERGKCSPTDPNVAGCVQSVLFHGEFLNTRTSAVHMVALVLGITFFVYIKLSYRPLVFGGVVGIIAMTINVCYGLFLPYFSPLTLGLAILKPLGLTFAMNVVFSIIMFPKTSSFAYFDGTKSVLSALNGLAKMHLDILNNDRPSKSSFDRYTKIAQTIAMLKGRLVMIDIDGAALKLEVAYGRLDKAVAGRFGVVLQHIMHQIQGFEVFYGYLHDCKKIIEKRASEPSSTIPDSKLAPDAKDNGQAHQTAPDHREIGEYEQLQKKWFEKTAKGNVRMEELDRIIQMMNSLFTPVLEAAGETFDELISWLEAANHFRAYTLVIPGDHKKHAKIQQERHQALLNARNKMVNLYEEIEKSEEWGSIVNSHFRSEPVLPSIMGQGCLFGFMVRQYVMSLDLMAKLFLKADEARPEPQLTFPWTKPIDVGIATDLAAAAAAAAQHLDNQPRDPEADPPQNIAQKIGQKISLWHRALGDKNFIIAFRSAICTLLITFPLFVRTTSWWFYSNRLVWTTIMAALATFGTLGDTLYAFIANSCYTFLSCALALAAWYIGNGHGQGNVYGMGVVYGVFFVFLMYYRHFSTHYLPLPAIILCVTFVLCLGTGWQDTHYPVVGNLGYGWEPSWKRFVTVIVGLSVGAFASIFPKPFTVKKMIRVNLGNILREIGSVHCDVGNFALSRIRDSETHILSTERDRVLGRFKKISGMMGDTRRKCRTVKFEPPLQGTWPSQKYLRLLKLQSELLMLYQYLYSVFNHVQDPQNRIHRMIQEYGWSNSSLNSDFLAVLHMSGSSLVMRTPLPMLTPAQTTVRHMEILQRRLDEEAEHGKNNVLQGGNRRLASTYDLTPDGRMSISGHSLVACIYEKVDTLALLTKELVGEEYEIDPYYFHKENYVEPSARETSYGSQAV